MAYPLTGMPDTMNLNVTTPNNNPSAVVLYEMLPWSNTTNTGNTYASLCVVRNKS
jgi:hypothetical protein